MRTRPEEKTVARMLRLVVCVTLLLSGVAVRLPHHHHSCHDICLRVGEPRRDCTGSGEKHDRHRTICSHTLLMALADRDDDQAGGDHFRELPACLPDAAMLPPCEKVGRAISPVISPAGVEGYAAGRQGRAPPDAV